MRTILHRLERVAEHPVLGFWRRFSATLPGVDSAAVAFNAFFALVPLLAVLLTGAAIIGQDVVVRRRTLRTLGLFAPGEVVKLVTGLLDSAAPRIADGGLWLIVGLSLVSLYSGARGVLSIQLALSRLQHREERRPWWRARLVGVALTLAAGGAFLLSSLILVAGRALAELLSIYLVPSLAFVQELWLAVLVPIASVGMFLFLLALYQFGPPRPLPRPWLAALVAGMGLVLVSLGFQAFLRYVTAFGAGFGSLAAVAVSLAWLYLGAYVILLGGFLVIDLERSVTGGEWRTLRFPR